MQGCTAHFRPASYSPSVSRTCIRLTLHSRQLTLVVRCWEYMHQMIILPPRGAQRRRQMIIHKKINNSLTYVNNTQAMMSSVTSCVLRKTCFGQHPMDKAATGERLAPLHSAKFQPASSTTLPPLAHPNRTLMSSTADYVAKYPRRAALLHTVEKYWLDDARRKFRPLDSGLPSAMLTCYR